MKEQLMEIVTNGLLGMMGGMTRYIFKLMSGEKEFSFGYMAGTLFISITIAVAIGDALPVGRFEHGRNGLMVFIGIVSFEIMKEIIERLPKIIGDKIIKK